MKLYIIYKMGSICAGQGMISINDPTKSKSNLSHKLDMLPITHRNSLDLFYSDYKLHANPIGYGDHGEVWLCNKQTNNKLRAVKIVSKSILPSLVIEENQIPKAVEKIKKCRNNSTVKIYKVYDSRNGYFIITEYVPEGDLHDLLEVHCLMTEPEAAKIIFQLLLAVSQLQDSGIRFNNLKPENVLVSDAQNLIVKLNPLNLFGVIRDEVDDAFICPEIFSGKYCDKSDSWSMGLIMYYLLSGSLPLKSEHAFQISSLTGSFVSSVSSKALNLMTGLLQIDTNSRISIKDALCHSWIQTYSEELEII